MLSINQFESSWPRDGFDCGNAHINGWFARQAGQSERRGTTRTFMAFDTYTCQLVGFYSLMNHTVKRDEFEEPVRYDKPAVLIAQLAVDKAAQGTGVGKLMLADALRRLRLILDTVGFELVVVDAIDGAAAAFYEKHGFSQLTKDGSRWFLPSTSLLAN
ncbi:MAG: hypothetical protein CVT64_11205 [Actinobacteria bacterium HGW-Actinobacteria-4]|nr:MAG: hypothetical protein CVT64_11205 [Actinobacteria bacterium HGW-Actinobacteria-4]